MKIDGEKVSLVPIDDCHTEKIVKWRNSVRKNFINRDLFTVESHTKWLNDIVRTGKAEQFIIIDKSNDKEVGSVFFRDIDYKNSKAEYGIFIGEKSARGKGIGSETARLMLDYGFRVMKLHKIMLRVFAFNNQAIKSYEKAGFVKEGYLCDDVFIDDKFYDIILMGAIQGDQL